MRNLRTLIFFSILIIVLSLIFYPNLKPIYHYSETTYLAPINVSIDKKDFLLDNQDVQEIRLLFFGDLMLDRHVGEIIERNSLDSLLSKLNEEEFTHNYDIVAANLEGAVTNEGAHFEPHNIYDFAFKPEIVAQLKNYGFNFFSVANNHVADQGIRGIEETYQNLSDLNFNYLGCQDSSFFVDNNNLPSFNSKLSLHNCSARLMEVKGHKIIFLAFSIVYGVIDEAEIIRQIESLRDEVDWLIVLPHWGIEYQNKAAPSQERLAKKMIEAGADAIIGSHPHVIQNYEVYQNKPIFYSLGNFIFDQYFSIETQEGLAVSLTFNKNTYPQFHIYKIKTRSSKIESIEQITSL